MKVKQAMHKNTDTCSPSETVARVAELMKVQDIGSVPIAENGKLVGMVTDRDIAIRAVADGRDAAQATARDVMSKNVAFCKEEEDLEDAVRIMEQKAVRRLPVLDKNDKLVGMLSLGDVSHAANQSLSGELIKSVSAHH